MNLTLRTLLPKIAIWAVVVFGSTQVNRLSLGSLHRACGPWGCLAPTASLLGMHCFWLAVCWPLVYFRPKSRGLIYWPAALGTAGLLVRCGWMLSTWSSKVDVRQVWPAMTSYACLSSVDFPFCALIVLSLVSGVRRRWTHSNDTKDFSP